MSERSPRDTGDGARPLQKMLESVDDLVVGLASVRYFAERDLATAIYLAVRLDRPLLLEGEAGVGKTEVAKALAALLGRRLIRLQCHEGLDLASAAYEWDYARQLLEIRLLEAAEAGGVDRDVAHRHLFSRAFLLRRPLLEAVDPGLDAEPPVLLIDELDRADEEFEAFLLELLSDWQITIPELGTVRAERPPIVVLTSNRTREVHDALRRRCLYHWLELPSFEKELEIVRCKVPRAEARLAEQAVRFVQALRAEDLYKKPGVAETLDWLTGLAALGAGELSEDVIEQTAGLLLKHQEDLADLKTRALAPALARARG